MLLGSNLRCCVPCLALLAALGHWCAQAADYEARQVSEQSDVSEYYRSPARDRFRFKAPPSQLNEVSLCDWFAAGAGSWAFVPCRTYMSPYAEYPNEIGLDPFAPLRFTSQPYPLRPPRPRGESVPGAPPSQLPTDRNYPSGVDFQSPQLLR
jgi:hypothetical protein